MSIATRFKRALSELIGPQQKAATDKNKLNYVLYSYAGGLVAPMKDNFENYVRNGYAGNPDVYAIISKITSRASSIPWSVWVEKDKNKAKQYRAAIQGKNFERAFELKAAAWEQVEHPILSKILEEPNGLQSFQELFTENSGYKLITGNSYLYGMKAAGFAGPTSLYNLPAHLTTVELTPNGNFYNPKDRRYSIDLSITKWDKFTGEEILHLKYWNPAELPTDFMYGMSPVKAANKVVSRSNDSYTAGMSALRNMGVNGILTQNAGAGDDAGIMTPNEAKALKAQWKANNAGPENFQDILVTSASVSWQNMGMSPVDLALIDQQKMDTKVLCNVYDFPIQLMNSEDASTYDNMNTAERMVYVQAVLPLLQSFQAGLNRFVAKPYSDKEGRRYSFEFDLSGVAALQEDRKKMEERVVLLVKEGIITPNEGRVKIGDEPLKGFDYMDKPREPKAPTEPKAPGTNNQ